MEMPTPPEDLDFQKYWLILKRHSVPATGVFLITVIIAALLALFSEKKYEAAGKLKFIKENATSALVTEAGEKIGRLDALKFEGSPVDTEAEVIRSAPVVQKTIQTLNLKDDKGELITYETFLRNLEVTNIPDTDILQVSYQDPDPQQAQLIVDTLMDNYVNQNVSVNRTAASSAKEFITQQLPKTEQQLKQAEANLRAFQEKYQVVNLGVESQLSVNQLGDIDNRIDQVKANLGKVNERIRELELKLGISSQEALSLNTLNDSPAVQQLVTKLKDVENQLASERSRFQDNNPSIIALQEEKAYLEQELARRTGRSIGSVGGNLQTGDIEKGLAQNLVNYEVERKSLAKELQSLTEAKANYRQRSNLLPQLQEQQRDLERKLEVAQTAYQTLLRNLQQAQIAENQNVNNAQIVSPAIASEFPVTLSKSAMLAAGLFAGSLLYVVTALILELRDPSLKTTKEVRSLLNYRLLGMIPHSQPQKFLPGVEMQEPTVPGRLVQEVPHSLMSEAYRMVQANLQFLEHQEDLKSIVITSSIPQEGKSTVSSNLATAVAQLGKKVLLIDADVHHPQQQEIWELDNSVGLLDVLQNQNLLDQAIKSVIPNLDVLTAGKALPNALALLNSPQMRSLFEELQQDYDLIIFDTPPLLLFADALTIGKLADGILMVVRPGVIEPSSANASKEMLEQSGQKILGLVVNGVVTKYEPDSYYYHAKAYAKNYGNRYVTTITQSNENQNN
ncbi:capsular exopolysaccharide family [Stanieria cyanosphaera PCC 7437]|uniref:non-specific protein-tyrosine kinase n=1 Tax=Stanieria cyanosphaera (strain ATCC 29371 / PCC 7437) TaxID=111780 RepID=K9XTK4_STAC7|nr:polysaccharide biosynthesis tyrosine autokinase [Stanieria cyanosphaera]AFZ35411.1 capsular exopolysaccharide family [Stanieria cyanosphaera PCC 7437]